MVKRKTNKKEKKKINKKTGRQKSKGSKISKVKKLIAFSKKRPKKKNIKKK